jgi:phosphohistidine swiveling domain-containing protein
MSAEEFGGKANSLNRLRGLGVDVPAAWVIPCRFTSLRPKIDLSGVEYRLRWSHYKEPEKVKFAVRSGAPVSMPGLLQTKLNVEWKDIPAAIEAVWDSWDADHAKQYREAKGLDHNMGTAVIIQMMVDAEYAGVAFTNHPSNVECPDIYAPLIEYVNGLGEALVSGEVTPTTADGSETWYNTLYKHLRFIHNSWGPSDVEWCVERSTGKLYFVQQRKLRFAAKPAAEPDASLGEVAVFGKSVGAPVVVTAKLVNADDFKPGDAIYASEFNPEMYPVMCKASAIVCAKGGETCHAAIIARELNKPAVSGVRVLYDWDEPEPDTKYIKLGQTFTIDGRTGHLHIPTEDAVKAAAEVKTVEAVLDESRKPDFRIRAGYYQMNALLYRFYYAMYDAKEGKISQERRDQIVGEIAKVLSTYFYIACLCEMRWVKHRTGSGEAKARAPLMRKFRRLGIVFPSHIISSHDKGMDRTKFANDRVPMPKTLKEAIKVMEATKQSFDGLTWCGSYGGNAWGKITEVLLSYLKGEVSDVLFVDQAFNLKHNSGVAFGKFLWLECEDGWLNQQLNAKAGSIMALRADEMAHKNSGYASYINDALTKQSILPAGIVQ